MNERPTPETDALILAKSGFGPTDWEWRQLSRRLERERDELQSKLNLSEKVFFKGSIIEDKLTTEQVAIIHSFGDCWVLGYNKHSRKMWEKALWLWSRDNKVEWSKDRCNVPSGISAPTE